MAEAKFELGQIVNMNPLQDYDVPAKILGVMHCLDGTVNYMVVRWDFGGSIIRHHVSEVELSELKGK